MEGLDLAHLWNLKKFQSYGKKFTWIKREKKNKWQKHEQSTMRKKNIAHNDLKLSTHVSQHENMTNKTCRLKIPVHKLEKSTNIQFRSHYKHTKK